MYALISHICINIHTCMHSYIHVYIDTYMCIICVFMSPHTYMSMHGCSDTSTKWFAYAAFSSYASRSTYSSMELTKKYEF